jgi:hypothetical protein
MILEQIKTRRGNELFLCLSEQDAIYLIQSLATMLQKNRLTSQTVKFNRFLGNVGIEVHISVWNEATYTEMLNGE